MKLLVKIPTRGRGFKWFRKYIDLADRTDTKFLISIDADDPQDVPEWVYDYATVVRGESRNKIHAINRDINEFAHDWDVLLIGSDDMEPMYFPYDQRILGDMEKHYPDTDGCLWYNTENSEVELQRRLKREVRFGDVNYYAKWICMLPVMGRTYYDRFGYVYHDAYTGFWCDNEFTDIARGLNRIACVDSRPLYHQHTDWGGGMPNDDTYKKYAGYFKPDMEIYRKRKARGFIS